MSLDLLIIHPGSAHGIYGSDLAESLVAVEPPLWCRLIAGYVRDRGFSVAILDAEAMKIGRQSVAGTALEMKPRLICLAVYGHQPSASTQQMVAAGEIAREIKKRTDVPIIMVGGHPSALPTRTWIEEQIDYVGVGEGPLTVVGLLRGDSLSEIHGLVYGDRRPRQAEGHILQNKAAPLIEDLSELHGNAWDLLPMEKYRAHNWQCFGDLSKRQPYASIYTSLGCPYKCSFCCINAPFDSNRYRMREPSSVAAEIEMLARDYGVWTFKVTDEMFVLNERHYTAICREIAGRFSPTERERLNIWAYARVDTVKPETLATLRAVGIRWLALGIESGSALVRDGANKKMRTEDIVGTVKMIQAADINVIGNFIFGLRDDNVYTMDETYNLAIKCMPDFANFYSCMAYPGSALYDQAVRSGWTLPETFAGYSQHNADCRPLDTEHISGAEVLKYRDTAFNEFFSDPRYLTHVEHKFGLAARKHIEQMTTYKLKRKILEAA